jgi:hypothetical protein
VAQATNYSTVIAIRKGKQSVMDDTKSKVLAYPRHLAKKAPSSVRNPFGTFKGQILDNGEVPFFEERGLCSVWINRSASRLPVDYAMGYLLAVEGSRCHVLRSEPLNCMAQALARSSIDQILTVRGCVRGEVFPVRAKCDCQTAALCPRNVKTSFPVSESQSLTVRSELALAIRLPSALKQTEFTAPKWPLSLKNSCPVATVRLELFHPVGK